MCIINYHEWGGGVGHDLFTCTNPNVCLKDSGLLHNAMSSEQLPVFWRIMVASSSGSSSPRDKALWAFTNTCARTWNLASVYVFKERQKVWSQVPCPRFKLEYFPNKAQKGSALSLSGQRTHFINNDLINILPFFPLVKPALSFSARCIKHFVIR